MKEKKKLSTARKIEHKNTEALYLIVRGLEVGLVAGLISVLYRFLLTNAESILYKILDYVKDSPLRIILWLVVLGIIGYVVYLITKFEPMSSGSGIPQVSGEVKGYLSPKWWKVIIAKLIGGTLSIVSGLSLGREGPSIQLGGMAGKGIAEITKADKTTTLRMISCGAGAGLAAAFNAPLAGIMFVLEEIHHSFDKSILCMGIVATVTADYISKLFFGQDTIFSYDTVNFPLKYYWLLILFGIVLGVSGVCYNVIMSKGQDIFKKIAFIPTWLKFVIVFAISGVVGLFAPQILGGGHSMVKILLHDHPTIIVMVVLLLAKFIFSVFSFGSGAPGGIFFPLLILGSYMGAIYGDLSVKLFSLDSGLWEEFIVIGMAGIFASIVRSPITGIVLVFEMTGNMNNILPLVTVSLISYAVATLIGVEPIYDILLTKIIKPTAEKVTLAKRSEKIIKSFIIPVGSELDGKMIKDIDWGRHCLIVTVERGEESITPNGTVVLKSGDEVVFLVSQRRYAKDNNNLEEIFSVK